MEAIAALFYFKKSKPCQDLSRAVVSLPSGRPAPFNRLSHMKEPCLPQPSGSVVRPGDVAVNVLLGAFSFESCLECKKYKVE